MCQRYHRGRPTLNSKSAEWLTEKVATTLRTLKFAFFTLLDQTGALVGSPTGRQIGLSNLRQLVRLPPQKGWNIQQILGIYFGT